MYSANDVGNICFMGLIFFGALALIGASEMWPVVGCMAAIVFVAVVLHK